MRLAQVLILLIAVAAGLLLPQTVLSSEKATPQDARAVVERAIAAAGGKDRLATLGTCTMTTKGVVLRDGRPRHFTATIWQALPGRMKQEIRYHEAAGDVTIVSAVDGDRAWQQVNGKLGPLPVEEAQGLRHSLASCPLKYLYPLLDPPYTLSSLDDTTVHGRPVVGVSVSSAGHPEGDLYFDKETGLLLKYVSRETDARGHIQVRQEFYERYEDLNGLPWPMHKTVYVGGRKIAEREAVSFQPYEQLAPAVFAPP